MIKYRFEIKSLLPHDLYTMKRIFFFFKKQNNDQSISPRLDTLPRLKSPVSHSIYQLQSERRFAGRIPFQKGISVMCNANLKLNPQHHVTLRNFK